MVSWDDLFQQLTTIKFKKIFSFFYQPLRLKLLFHFVCPQNSEILAHFPLYFQNQNQNKKHV